MKQVEDKRKQEKEMVYQMILLYCKKKHRQSLCDECQNLYDYACKRIDKCPFMETKSFCSSCRVHCYQKEKRTQIREVMRFSGPRMLWHHPLMAIHHMITTWKEKRKI